ncbi:MAG TPA: hypothetical protein PKW17_13570 [Smithellaceae bacterium]|nr:hypothetical protein [Smithellaceae bacterium]
MKEVPFSITKVNGAFLFFARSVFWRFQLKGKLQKIDGFLSRNIMSDYLKLIK